MKFAAFIKSLGHMTRMMKSAMLLLFQGLYVKDIFKIYQKRFGQIVKILANFDIY